MCQWYEVFFCCCCPFLDNKGHCPDMDEPEEEGNETEEPP